MFGEIISNAWKVFWKRMLKNDAVRNEGWHKPGTVKHEFKLNESHIEISTDFLIRNYKTILRGEDDITECSECHRALKSKTVGFSFNLSGRVLPFPVLYCPKCDGKPQDYSTMICTVNGNLIFP